MLVRKKKEDMKKRRLPDESYVNDTVESLRSWIQKIEQSTTSVSSRLSAVEKRISGVKNESDGEYGVSLGGPIQTLVLNGKKKNTSELVKVIDAELSLLHNTLVSQQQELGTLKGILTDTEKNVHTIQTELQAVKTNMSVMENALEHHMEQTGRQDLFKIRLGAMEIPVEFSGLIGGLLAFSIAILVLIDQKAVLLSPVFLFCVGVLLIGSAMVKMVRIRSRSTLRPCFSMPLTTSSVQLHPVLCERKEG